MTTLEQERSKSKRKKRVGIVVKDKMQKTIIVEVTRSFIHPKYKTIVRKTRKFAAHDETNDCHVGDVVRIEETRPLSRTKHWRVREIIERAK